MFPIPKDRPIPSIIEQNKDVESFVIQGASPRSVFFRDSFKPLQFVHFTDVHAVPEIWERIVDYVNYYEDYLAFALHTGDYCGRDQGVYEDLYGQHSPDNRPILNCVGNHDTLPKDEKKCGPKTVVKDLLFKTAESWDATFLPGKDSLSYYKDFPDSNLRLIVLDFYYDMEPQVHWLNDLLNEARDLKLHVITAGHETTNPIVYKENVTFQTRDDYESKGGNATKSPFDRIIADFKKAGGIHVCHLAGHEHADMFGKTENGVLNVVAECATSWKGWCDGDRARGTKTYDCFNVIAIDPNQHLLKIVRIGNNADHYLRIKRTLCYDYKNGAVVFNG